MIFTIAFGIILAPILLALLPAALMICIFGAIILIPLAITTFVFYQFGMVPGVLALVVMLGFFRRVVK